MNRSREEEAATPARPRHSVTRAAVEALVQFSEQERLWAARQAHESFAGILAEHAAALEEIRDQLREALENGGDGVRDGISRGPVWRASTLLDQEIIYIRQLGGEEETDAHED